MIYLIFLISAAVVVYSGLKLSVYGDAVAEKTGLGHSFVGIALIAFFTSLPELISTIGAVTIVDAPDLAFGNVFGSNMFNMLIIFILDAVFRKTDMYKDISLANWIAGFYAVIIMLFTMFGFTMNFSKINGISVLSVIIVILYFFSAYSTFKASSEDTASEKEDDDDEGISVKKAVYMFLFFAFLIVVAGLALSKTADSIAESTGLGRSFVGSFFLAIVTSLPELSSCYAAVRIGAVNMAIGGLFGSNVFNIVIIPVADFIYLKSPIFDAVAKTHLNSAIFAAAATVVALLGAREAKTLKLRFFGISPHSYVIFGLYIFYALYLYSVR